MLKVYLAGPEVFHPEAPSIGNSKKEICREMGFEGLFPFDNEVAPGSGAGSARLDSLIYRENLGMLRRADFGIFNLTPFRGVSADAGTVFELGAFVGMGKQVFGYSDDGRVMIDRVRACRPCVQARDGWRDDDAMLIEDFGNFDNLMLACALKESGGDAVLGTAARPAGFTDLTVFRRCVAMAREMFQGGR